MSINPLDKFRQYSYDTVMSAKAPAAPAHGKPADYGFEGSRPNSPLTVGSGARMAGYGLLEGLASAGLKNVEDAIVVGLEPVINSAAQIIKGEKSFDFTPNLGVLGRGMY